MKKLIFAAIALCVSHSSFSQSFSIPHDTVSATVTTMLNMYNNMTNISNADIQVTWSVTEHNMPADWGASFAICDNNLCYYNINNTLLGGDAYTTDPIVPNETATFYVLPDLTNATTTGTYYVKVNMVNGATVIPSWYIINKWPTGINTVSYNNQNIVVYPNPTTDEFNVLIDDKAQVDKLIVTDISGRIVYTSKPTGTASSINASNLARGVYVIKAVDGEGKIQAISKVNKI